jgi:hypothetical protein
MIASLNFQARGINVFAMRLCRRNGPLFKEDDFAIGSRKISTKSHCNYHVLSFATNNEKLPRLPRIFWLFEVIRCIQSESGIGGLQTLNKAHD